MTRRSIHHVVEIAPTARVERIDPTTNNTLTGDHS